MPDPEDPSPDQPLVPEDGETPGKPEQGPYSVLSTQYSVPGVAQSILLLGSDHTELGEVEIAELSPHVAVGISRGRFPKGYAHVDPNEDAVFAATDGTTAIIAVADGHHGFDAAEAAIGS
ncbi:MAG: hypothetical protein U9R47_08390, partial [Actinomycetota bacterium]|nr:hypothetical protein [Actinomycetota bacterium]